MGDAYPELVASKERVEQVLKQEEERFAETLEHGMEVLESAMRKEDRMLEGATVFKLYDTFGFPLDLTADIARERGFTVDFAGFEAEMEQQRERARAKSRFHMQAGVEYQGRPTRFEGYDTLRVEARVLALYREGISVSAIEAGETGVVVLDRTPFYAESGGQVGDSGELVSGAGTFLVEDTQKIQAEVFGHKGRLDTGRLAVGDEVTAVVDATLRQRVAYNHSATHLLHAALRQVLGTHVQQKGSLVDAERTRFDFSHHQPVTPEEIARIEALVNAEIRHNVPVEARLMKYDEAIKAGAMALFGEKYGDEVRVIGMGTFSTELCGGTHVRRSGDIGFFKVVSESGVAAGIRRIEAVTADSALAYAQAQDRQLTEIAGLLKAPQPEIGTKLQQVVENVRRLEKELVRLKSRLAASQGNDLATQARLIGGHHVLAATLEGADAKALRETVDKLKDKLKSAVVVLGSTEGDKVTLIAGVTPDLTARVKAGELVGYVAGQVGGKGGGRPDLAQGGGADPAALPKAMASVDGWVENRLGQS
jgi:alanyl-tRNA synthetase